MWLWKLFWPLCVSSNSRDHKKQELLGENLQEVIYIGCWVGPGNSCFSMCENKNPHIRLSTFKDFWGCWVHSVITGIIWSRYVIQIFINAYYLPDKIGQNFLKSQKYSNSNVQVNNYEIVVKKFHISHNLTWYLAIFHKFTRIYRVCSTYELTKQFM